MPDAWHAQAGIIFIAAVPPDRDVDGQTIAFHPPTMPIFEGRYSGRTSSINSMVTIPAVGGSSGSAILNDKMELVGILFATHPMFNIVTLSSSYESTAVFMNKGFKKILNVD